MENIHDIPYSFIFMYLILKYLTNLVMNVLLISTDYVPIGPRFSNLVLQALLVLLSVTCMLIFTDYVPIGPRFSNLVLQALLVLLKKPPPPVSVFCAIFIFRI